MKPRKNVGACWRHHGRVEEVTNLDSYAEKFSFLYGVG